MYATMTDTPQSLTTIGCQDDYIVPHPGWRVAEYDAVVVENVVKHLNNGNYYWGTHCLVFNDGTSYYTNNGSPCGGSILRSADSVNPMGAVEECW